MAFLCILVALTFAAANGFLITRPTYWNGLRVTWGPNPFSSNSFVGLPTQEHVAIREGYTKISDCSGNAKVLGTKYVKNNDSSVALLFDTRGYIAGIQSGIPTNMSNHYPFPHIKPPFIKDGDLYTITAYFVDPAIICTTGRNAAEFAAQGTGNRLYIQNGTDPIHDLITIPLVQSEMNQTAWTLGKCFPTMGVHYWYKLSADMDCQDFFPVFLLFNNQKLDAFGWAFEGSLSSPKYEHPPLFTIGAFMKNVPTCIADFMPVSTMHIYLNDSPQYDLC